jgi:uncharacterized membrane protein YeiH
MGRSESLDAKNPAIIYAVRIPIGAFGGALRDVLNTK